MILLTKEEIQSVFSMKDAIEADKKCFSMFSEGKAIVPIRTNIQASKEEGTFLFMPSYVEDIKMAGLKIVSVFPNNAKKGIPTIPAQVMLIDGVTGIVTAMMDGTYVTQLRTGASSGAAFDILGVKNASVGALIGTGGQAPCQLEAMLAARKLKVVKVSARNFEKTKVFVEKMNKELEGYGTDIIAVETSDEAVDGADLIITATVAEKPVFDASKIKKGATISCVGAYQPNMQEMDPAILPMASKIYFDSEEAVLAESGDILTPLKEGIITKEDFTGDIGDVLLGKIPGRENDEEIIVYENVGIGALDLVAGADIYSRAKDAGIGTKWGE